MPNEITAAEVESAQGGQTVIIPLRDGTVATMRWNGTALVLVPVPESVTIQEGLTPGEGVDG